MPCFLLLTVDSSKQCLEPLKNLLLGRIGSRLCAAAVEDIDSLNFAGLRDMLLAEGPLDVAWIKKVSLLLNAELAPVFPHEVKLKLNHCRCVVNVAWSKWYGQINCLRTLVTSSCVPENLCFGHGRWQLIAATVGQVNAAEAEFWRRSQGTRVDYSDRILGFECGGQQWVNEVSFPVGTLKEPNGKDLDYMVRTRGNC